MQCPKCQFENLEGSKFCGGCGEKFILSCPDCGANNPAENRFCNECGFNLKPVKEVPGRITELKSPAVFPTKEILTADTSSINGERKHVTVLFSDLTGYAAMSKKLDPEEVKEITIRIFGGISKIVAHYDGFIEKYAGDAVMVIFGVPQAHEDDPVRAIKAAREIHQLVDSIGPEVENKIGHSISMHTGINTGLVVTGEVDMQRGTHGIAGDTINLASRLSNLAKPGEILIDGDACRQVEGQFLCEYLETNTVIAKADPVQVYKVLSQRDKPLTIRRLSGLRANLVGRKVEMSELTEAVENLQKGKGKIFSVCGAAGTGKSRLIEEFKARLDLEKIQWIEGHAFAYSQNIPYFPLVDLLNRVLRIEEKDPPDKVKEKVESGIESLVGENEGVIPYVGVLYSMHYPQLEKVSPEFWKSRLQASILTILSALAQRAPTVFFLEDLHWADSSFVELLRRACLEIRHPAIVLCAYRPGFILFTGNQLSSIDKYYHEIRLQDLSLSEAHDMLESLLKTGSIPPDLKRWVQSKAEGNPFYLEELVNTLIESETLKQDNGDWQLSRPISESDIPSSLHGLNAGRIDRLERQTKRIIQEASVIGRYFLYEILKRITELEDRIDKVLGSLELLDLIRPRSLQPDLEYMFKHVLTQEIVYNGLLKKQRREFHEKIAQVMEGLFQDRLPEFYETLAFHFERGQSINRAIDYLIKSGEKSLARYAVEDAHQYFKKAYDILTSKEELSEAEKIILIDLLNSWGYAYYYLGEIKEFIDLFKSHQVLTESLQDKSRVGMFFAWLGIFNFLSGECRKSYEYLRKGLELGEKTKNQKVVGYACTWLTFTCGELGSFKEGIAFGEKAQEIAESFPADHYLFFKSLAGLCLIDWYKGNIREVFEGAKRLIEYGDRNANSRSKVFGYWIKALGHLCSGDMKSSQNSHEKAIELAVDPAYPNYPKSTLGLAYFIGGRLQEAENVLQSALDFCESRGMGQISVACQCFLSPILIAKGHMKQGAEMLETTRRIMFRNQRRVQYALSEYIVGEVNSQIATGPKPSLSIMAKNISFLVRNVPFAPKKAEEHFNKAIELLKEIDAKGLLGPVYLSLGRLYKASKRAQHARQCISEAINIFHECQAEAYLKQANEALDSLG